MIGQARKLLYRIAQVWRSCGTGLGVRYALAVAWNVRSVMRRRNLQQADAMMTGTARVAFRGQTLIVPFTETDQANTIEGDAPTFASIREILCDDVYVRGFAALGEIETFVDLGANRGMVSLLAARGLGARKVVSVEAQVPYSACFDVLAQANGLTQDQRHRVVKFAGATDDNETITVDGLCKEFNIEAIDLLKCDIEGGENAVVLGGAPPFWERVRLVAMELHPEAGTRTGEIVETMVADGFHISLTDPDGIPIESERATYLFGSREPGDLAFPISARPD
ncbi:MAG: FkbM family methyltransferase [Pseudomonadota bacterium]